MKQLPVLPVQTAGLAAVVLLAGCNQLKGSAHGNEEMLELCIGLAAEKLGLPDGRAAAVNPSFDLSIDYGPFGSYTARLADVRFEGPRSPVKIECAGDGNSRQLSSLKIDEAGYRFSPPKEWDSE